MAGAACSIQQFWRRCTARDRASRMLAAARKGGLTRAWYRLWRDARVACATKIQRAFRRCARIAYWRAIAAALLAGKKARLQVLAETAARLIQARWRAIKEARRHRAIIEAETAYLREQAEMRRVHRAVTRADPELEREARARARMHRADREASARGNRALRAATGGLLGTDYKEKEQAAEFAVRSMMRRMVREAGVVSVAITVGERERLERQQRNDRLKASGRPHEVMLRYDLSAALPPDKALASLQ